MENILSAAGLTLAICITAIFAIMLLSIVFKALEIAFYVLAIKSKVYAAMYKQKHIMLDSKTGILIVCNHPEGDESVK